MKRELTYAAIAVLLGAALMFAPYWVLSIQRKTMAPAFSRDQSRTLSESLKILSAESETSAGIVPHYPMDAISVGLILTLSLILALIISLTVKKRLA